MCHVMSCYVVLCDVLYHFYLLNAFLHARSSQFCSLFIYFSSYLCLCLFLYLVLFLSLSSSSLYYYSILSFFLFLSLTLSTTLSRSPHDHISLSLPISLLVSISSSPLPEFYFKQFFPFTYMIIYLFIKCRGRRY